MNHKFDLPDTLGHTLPAAVDGQPVALRTRARRSDNNQGRVQLRRDGWCQRLCPSEGCSHPALSPLETPRSTRTAFSPGDLASTANTDEYLESLRTVDQGFETRLWALTNRLTATLGTEHTSSLTQNLLEDLLRKILDNKDDITETKLQLLADDIRTHLTANADSHRLARSITSHMANLAEDLVVASTNPDQPLQAALHFLHQHGCSSWEQLSEKIHRLENDAYVGQFAGQPHPPHAPPAQSNQQPTGTNPAFDANLIHLEQKNSTTSNNTWSSDLSSLLASMNLCNGPTLEPFDGRGKRTFAEFLRDFRWRYGQLPDNTQRAYLSSSLIHNAKDVFNSLDPRTQEGPFDGLLTALQRALTQTTHTSINTLTAHLRRCTRQTNQPLTRYLTELELTAQRLFVPKDTKDKEFVEVTKANVLMENVHEKDLARDLLEVLTTTPSADVFTTMKSRVLAFETTNELLKINMSNKQPQPNFNRPWVNNMNNGSNERRPGPPQPPSNPAQQFQRQPFNPRNRIGHVKLINIDNSNDNEDNYPTDDEPHNPLGDIQPDWYGNEDNSPPEPAPAHVRSIIPDPGGSFTPATPRPRKDHSNHSPDPSRISVRKFGSYSPWHASLNPTRSLNTGLGPPNQEHSVIADEDLGSSRPS
ncbi:hypothetical protein AAVH_24961 [Aphelenchoides avenae]|nr:hypothetical protein AAVH_24961 [Aphelenchus avenae]